MPTDDTIVPLGAAYFPVPAGSPTRSYAFLLVPGFTLLAFSSAVEPLRIANQLSQQPLYRWQLMSETGAPVASSSGISVCVDAPIGPMDRATRAFVCAGNPPSAAAAPKVVAAIQRHARFGGAVGGICTGAVALAAAGLLEDHAFTLHWENQPTFREDFPALCPSANRFEISGPVMTCGGGAAATDMMLSLIAEDHGAEFSAMVSEMCLRKVMVGIEKEQRSSLSVLIRSRNPGLLNIVTLMNAHIEDPLTLDDLSRVAGYSRRHIERMFLSVLGETPGEFYRGIRLDHGRTLLSTTDMGLLEVALACGFGSVAHFSKSFKARFGTAPTKFNRTIRGARKTR
ncbi:GlxA family transcriptional regulator [Paenirhodobacter hankyongi]|uniref:GlxA family transcriptional regulator n=1 Tax=Paenirhodobacter hankyongi TaxID=2294033 RepID=A0A421BPU1_9RHOB|nr:GlxA family transcriptional regulator [Sinirhodobacter hankyongi]RLL64947.1 GlxA family transcriptional regulator [Sinirhodobacter hankyongi]